MAHPYGSNTTIEETIGKDLQDALATLDATITEANALAKAREDADNEVDAALAQRYEVPFAAITATPATPGVVTTISDYLTAAILYEKRHPGSPFATSYRASADRLLARIVDRTYAVPGATEVDADEATIGMSRNSNIEPTFAGYDSDNDDRMRDW
jgi:uncharacterized protein YlxW (UPF0749 family)